MTNRLNDSIRILSAGIACAWGIAGCNIFDVDTKSLQAEITTWLDEEYDIEAEDVECPKVKRREGEDFKCKVKAESGQKFKVQVEQSSNGFEWYIEGGVLSEEQLEEHIEKVLRKNDRPVPDELEVSCEDEPLILAEDDKGECTVETEAGEETFVVEVTDVDGREFEFDLDFI